MYRTVYLLLSSLLLFGCATKKQDTFVLPFYNEPDFTPVFIKNKTQIESEIKHKIADFSFLNQDSIFISQTDVEGDIYVANFIFTSCGSICPTMTKNLKIVADTFKDKNDVAFLSFSVTPWIDKPSVLKKYKTTNGIENKNWQFLTGSKEKIYTLARKSYFAEEDIGFSKDSSEFLHTEHFVLVDKSKRIRGIYNGTLKLEMQQLIADINALRAEDL